MTSYRYYPLAKTRDAELRCFEKLSEHSPEVFDSMLPIYELTKSRKSKRAPDGNIHQRMKKIAEIQQGRPFILDLSTDEKYCNIQIEQLLSEQNGFHEWQIFLFEHYSDLNIVPMVHLYEDASDSYPEVENFVSRASVERKLMAVRIPYDLDDEEIRAYLTPIKNRLDPECSIIVILDGNYIRDEAETNFANVVSKFCESANRVISLFGSQLADVVTMCSSFPLSATKEAERSGIPKSRADYEGEFKFYETIIYEAAKSKVAELKYGDYASINNQQIEIKGGTFVPRIDIAIDKETFIYKRYRRDDGSYQRCAENLVKDARYLKTGGWAEIEIDLANSGSPSGISPSFWISVRMDYYIRSRLGLYT